ncbi:MAG: dUTP diphosphatase [Taibaiella sp.]|nr:dUTP diphosphatase [Taibaiella sp.]
MVAIEVINKSPHVLPKYETEGSSGMDIRAWLKEPVVLKSLERMLIPTGLFIAIPQQYEGQVRPRSGLAIKKGLTLVNTPGTIDSDYRGELMIPLINLSANEQTIVDGDRIAQIIFAKYERAEWKQVTILQDTVRGTGGFGHSGSN